VQNTTLYPGAGDAYHLMVPGTLAASFNMIHVMAASFLSEGISNPATVLKSKDGRVLRTFPAGTIISGLSVGDFLQMAGIDLDDYNVQPWIRGGDLAFQPRFRLTGVALLVRMEYTTHRMWEWPSSKYGSPLCTITVERVPTAWGFLGSSNSYMPGAGPVLLTQTGIKLQFVPGGLVGVFDPFSVVLRLIEAVVLFGIAEYITDKLAQHVFHRGIYHSIFVSHVSADSITASKSQWRASKRLADARRSRQGISMGRLLSEWRSSTRVAAVEPEPVETAQTSAAAGGSTARTATLVATTVAPSPVAEVPASPAGVVTDNPLSLAATSANDGAGSVKAE